ncbi:hypothetical protein QBC33DRAFT_553541 [Phialemonium atrogriseum]|uniref:Transmembrane protein n=1 Tax=Phialemonium atrogriseum TaxID=1093897 RepID=A0AAJ0BNL3_9PEZI|nr:uncharacterized protein QBC33DRAFT_553541 [Phialemonium atrogriseum]KAK1761615.1 hypothetical protein QBC33DRAFT_553541 [Phialemonium atrogriseum]
MDPLDDRRKRNIDPALRGPGSGSSSTTTTSYTTSTSTSRGFNFGVGNSLPLQAQDSSFGFPPGSTVSYGGGGSVGPGPRGAMYAGSPTMFGSSSGADGTTTWSTVPSDSHAVFPSTWPPPPSNSFTEFQRRSDEEMEREQRRCLIFAAVMFAVVVGIFIVSWLAGGDGGTETGSRSSTSSWGFWIPLGPLWIGWGSEGFRWAFSFSF